MDELLQLQQYQFEVRQLGYVVLAVSGYENPQTLPSWLVKKGADVSWVYYQ